jgi:hypothetical protein
MKHGFFNRQDAKLQRKAETGGRRPETGNLRPE